MTPPTPAPEPTAEEEITTKLYRAFWELQRHGRKPAAIYLGHFYRRELDKIVMTKDTVYGEGMNKFCNVPVYWIVGHDKHFNVVAEQPYAY